ncbi:MAG TPA: ATP-binding protein [Opitutaceae bacterium]|jgi:PAS domain S-box-containing protein|nr:ATP-binding protein [Opitutaceae bacterium]
MNPYWQILPWLIIVLGAALYLRSRRRHKRALAKTNLGLQRILQAVASASDAIGIGDFEGNSTYHNKAHMALFGYTVEELNALPGSGTLFADKATAKAIMASIYARKSWQGETDILTKAGKRIPAFVRADIILDDQGNRVGIFGVFRDITKERRMAEEVARASKIDSLGLMAGGIAHDFNNLLTVMLGQVLMAQMEPFDEMGVKESLEEIRKVTLRARDLTLRLKSFAKGETPSMALIELPGILSEAVNLALKGSSVRAVLDIQESLAAVMADETQILQVLHNLALNAVQAMPGGGTLTLKATSVQPGESNFIAVAGRTWVRISISDTGMGIPTENLGRVFEPFFTTKPKGTGLGLATCYSIVKRHGGYLSVDSIVGTGTTFTMLLPASDLVPVHA